MQRNVKKCREMQRTADKFREMQRNAHRCREIINTRAPDRANNASVEF